MKIGILFVVFLTVWGRHHLQYNLLGKMFVCILPCWKLVNECNLYFLPSIFKFCCFFFMEFVLMNCKKRKDNLMVCTSSKVWSYVRKWLLYILHSHFLCFWSCSILITDKQSVVCICLILGWSFPACQRNLAFPWTIQYQQPYSLYLTCIKKITSN